MIDIAKMSIGNILAKHKIEVNPNAKPVNYNWEEAKEFLTYCGIKAEDKVIIHLLRLFKVYGKQSVLGLKSWLKDNRYDTEKVFGLMVWKIQERQKSKLKIVPILGVDKGVK